MVKGMYMINKRPKKIPKSEYSQSYWRIGDLHPNNVILRCDYEETGCVLSDS